jgi:hypothetical protein
MNMLSPEEFAERVTEIADSVQPADTTAYYDPDGDCIEFVARQEPFWAERIDDLVTVYYSEETGEVIGSLIKGVSQFMQKHPGFAILVKAGKVRLSHIFLAGLLCDRPEGQSVEVRTYEKKEKVYADLLDRADETRAEAVMS